jgi:hypothetical protein
LALGDDAQAAGMDILTGTEDRREGWQEIVKTRDYLAQKLAALVLSAAKITSGVFHLDRIPTIGDAKISDVASSKVSGAWEGDIDTPWHIKTTAGYTGLSTYNQSVAGLGGFRAVYVAANGLFGGVTSSRRFKQAIVKAAIPRETLRAVRVVFFKYRADVRSAFTEQVHLGAIAEELHDLGLTWLVDYQDDKPFAINERMIPWLGILLAQDAEDRLDALEARLAKIDGGEK